MSETTQHGYALRMRQLPKAEYHLSKALITRYALDDMTELFAVALRLMHEISRYQPERHTGEQWIAQVIDSYRSMSDKDRIEEYKQT